MNAGESSASGEGDRNAPPAPPAPEHVRDGLRCIRCAYDLSGLGADGVCPECGGDIARSIHGDLLRFARVPYLRRLRLAAVGVTTSMLCLVNLPLALGLVVLAFDTSGAGAGAMQTLTAVGAGTTFMLLLALTISWWALTTPDPERLRDDGMARWRKIARWGYLAAAVPVVASAALPSSITAYPPLSAFGLWIEVDAMLAILAGLIGLIAHAAGLRYTGALAKRAQDKPLGVRVVVGLVHAALLAGVGGAICVVAPLPTRWAHRVGPVFGVALLMLLVLLLAIIPVVYDRLRVALTRAIAQASQDTMPTTPVATASAR